MKKSSGLWRLGPTPEGIDSPSWGSSTWLTAVVVRAETPDDARKLAATAFTARRAPDADQDTPRSASPWLDDHLVKCCRIVSISPPREDSPAAD